MSAKNETMADEGGESLRRKAWEGVADAIRRGGYVPGDRLPPEREFAARLAVSRSTLRLALHDLERAGVVVRRPGRGGGTFLAAPRSERDLCGFTGLGDYLRRQGLLEGSHVLGVSLAEAGPAVAEALLLAPCDPVVVISRVRLSGGEPVALERSRFPAERFPGLAEQALGGSLCDLLRERFGEVPDRAVERIEPVAADEETGGLLGVPPGTPLLAVRRVTHNAAGHPIEQADDLVRGDHTRVVVWSGDERIGPEHRDTARGLDRSPGLTPQWP